MAKTLFKYASPRVQSRMLSGPEGPTLKCSYPKDFNDPYELFLSIDRNEDPELLAFYGDVVGDIPQIATTCFSRSPSVIPMWAHYADNSRGFVIEINEEVLAAAYPESGFGDVDYRDTPDPELNSLLSYAFATCKSRHTYMLRGAVFSAAYYTKATCWAYEHERRMVVREDEIRLENDLLLLDVPTKAVVRLIAGHSATDETRASLKERANSFGCVFAQMHIGRTSAVPYFVDGNGSASMFDGTTFIPVTNRCGQCGEPIGEEVAQCTLCQITDAHRASAAQNNPYRMLHRLGLLDEYVRDMDAITESHRQSAAESPK